MYSSKGWQSQKIHHMNNIKEKKEPCPGWLITKIVKQPPLKPEQPPLKPESNRDDISLDKSKENLSNVNGDNNHNGDTNHNGVKSSETTRSETKHLKKDGLPVKVLRENYLSANNLNIEKNKRTEDTPIQLPIHRKILESKFQNAFSKTISNSASKEINFLPMRRANTSDSIKTLANSPEPLTPTKRRMSTDNLNIRKFQDFESLSALIEMKTKAYDKIMTPLKQRHLTDASSTGSLDTSKISSGETTPELEQILNNIEYINRHHLNIAANERLGVTERTPNKNRSNTNENSGTPTSEEYRKTVKNVSTSYNHEGIWKPPDRVNGSDVSNNNTVAIHPKVIWRSDKKEKPKTTDSVPTRKLSERKIPDVLISSNSFENDMDPKINSNSSKLARPASTPPETYLINTDFNVTPSTTTKVCEVSDENNNDVKNDMTAKHVTRHRIAKLESFKKDYTFLQSPRMENKITSSINKITISKKVVELNVRHLAMFKNISPTAPQYEQQTRSIDELNSEAHQKVSPTLKPLEISFDFVQMKKRASRLKNQAKSMPNVVDIDDDCLTTNNLENTSLTHEYNSHVYNPAVGVEIDTANLSGKMVYSTQNDMGLMLSQKYYSSLSLTTPESIV